MLKVELELDDDLQQEVTSRTKKLRMTSDEYVRALLLEDITKQQLKEVKILENKIIEEVLKIQKILEKK